MTDELNKAIEKLKKDGHQPGQHFIDKARHLFVVIDGVALKPGDVIRLANGQVTLEELKL